MPVLTSFATIKSLLGLKQAVASDYPALEQILDDVDVAIGQYLGRHITQAERTEHVDLYEPAKMISLMGLPVVAVSSISVDSDYEFPTDFGLRLDEPARGKITVTYVGGPEIPPENWARAANIQVRHELKIVDNPGAELVATDGGTVRRPPIELLPEVKRLLRFDRHPLTREL